MNQIVDEHNMTRLKLHREVINALGQLDVALKKINDFDVTHPWLKGDTVLRTLEVLNRRYGKKKS